MEFVRTVCEFLEWTTPSGKVKEKQCTDFLEQLEEEGVITLPPPDGTPRKGIKIKIPKIDFCTEEIEGEVRDFEPIVLEMVRRGKRMKRWRAYVDQYHILGDKQVFGSRLQYFVKSKDKELGCLQFSASAWALKERDSWIGWSVNDRKQRLYLIVNNSRFLIFPWVHIHNLASKVLSLSARQIKEDWLKEYCYEPVLLETFVDTEHFKGTMLQSR
jgi:hypothetical protein